MMISNKKELENLGAKNDILLNSITDLIIVVKNEPNYSIEFVNQCEFLNYLGYSKNKLIEKSFLKLLHSDYLNEIDKILKKEHSLENGVHEVQLKDIKKDYIWAELRTKKFKNDLNESLILINLKDLTKIKKLEEEIKFNEERFKKITNTIPEIRFWKLFNPKKLEEALKSSYEMLETVTENIPQYIFWKDNNLNYLGCNDNYAKLVNIEHSENIINKTDAEILWNSDQIKYNEEQEKKIIVSKNTKFHIIETWILKDGSTIWVDTNRLPLYDSDNNIVGILVTFEDITERKKSEEKLQREHQKLERIMETNPVGIISIDKSGTVIYMNSQAENVLKVPRDQMVGTLLKKSSFKLLDNENNIIPDQARPYQRILKDKKPIKDMILNCKLPNSKEIILISLNATPLTTQDGEIENIIFTVADITEKVQAEQKIKESEKKYRALLETSSVGILEVDVLNQTISYVNPTLIDIMGYQETEFLYDNLANKIIHPDDFLKIIRSSEGMDLEIRIITKKGKLKWLHGKRSDQHDDEGNLILFRLWVEDITEKKMYEELIYELNINFLNFTTNTYKNIQLLLNTCLKLLDGNLVLYINKITGEDKEEYRITTNKGDIQTYDASDFYANLFCSEIFKQNHDFPQEYFDVDQMEFRLTDTYIKDNNIKTCYGKLIITGNELNNAICVLYKSTPIISNQNKLVLFLICDALEIEQKRWQAQEHLEAQNIMLSEINKLKSDLFSRTSHELKTPLISIKGFTELLLKFHAHKLDPEVISILEEIKRGSKRLENYVNAIVESSRLEQGLIKLNKTKENLSFLCQYCVRQLEGMAELRNQKIEMNVDANIILSFDKERIYEVVSNLILNAVKYTPEGGTILISSKKKGDFYIISVHDTGIGITEEERKLLFTQFGKIERYGQGFDVGIEGTGLGLYISKEIVELHGGEIWVISKGRNKGSTFAFSLPIDEI
ncbi:MAG: PAS domain S-box protein [Candidatus Lokiarchaeota archaeon]|nr:PAS domain S-box protein [Candidatus Lokiarchaeota archaeon]